MQSLKECWNFVGSGTVPATAGQNLLVSAITGAAPPTVKYVGGAARSSVECALTAANQAQVACAYNGDVLWLPIDGIQRVRFRARISTALTGVAEAAFGIASARNDTLNTIAEVLMFRKNGTGNLLVETDDGTTDLSEDTGLVLPDSTFRTYELAFTTRGGKANVHFYAENPANGRVERLVSGTTFSLSAYAGGLQFFAQVNKGASTDVGVLQVDSAEFEFKE